MEFLVISACVVYKYICIHNANPLQMEERE